MIQCAFSIMILIFATLFIGCSNDFRQIPAGYVGKKLTPSGWDKGILEASLVDIGVKNHDGTYTSLIILEATSVSLKESFGMAVASGGEDHRILIGKTPVSVDVYVRMMIPQDPDRRNALFAQVTPQGSSEDRVSVITIQKVYSQFAQMDVRSGVRSVLQKETDVYKIINNLDSFNEKLGAMTIEMFQKSGVPLDVQNVTLSNVKMDASVWEAENQKAAAIAQVEAINKVGAALKANPEYLMIRKYDTYEKIKDKIGTFTIIEGNPNGIVIK